MYLPIERVVLHFVNYFGGHRTAGNAIVDDICNAKEYCTYLCTYDTCTFGFGHVSEHLIYQTKLRFSTKCRVMMMSQ